MISRSLDVLQVKAIGKQNARKKVASYVISTEVYGWVDVQEDVLPFLQVVLVGVRFLSRP